MCNCVKCKGELPEGAPFCCWCGKRQTPEPRRALKRANGSGTVYKLSGRRTRPWVAAISDVIVGYFARKSEALDALARLVDVDITERFNMTFAEVYREWKQEHYPSLTDDTRKSYDYSFRIFAPIHARRFRELRTKDFQAALEPQMGKSHSSVAKHKQLITQLSEWAVREDVATNNYAKYVILPEQTRKKKEIFTAADIAKLEADGSSAAAVVLMLIYTGMRINELFTLRCADYHGSYVIGGEKTEAGRERVIPIRPEGRRYFEQMAAAANGPLLISGYSGQRVAPNFRRRDYYPLLDRLGIARKTPHATRHTFASWAVEQGIKPELLQKILGHADYSTTANIYVHTNIDQLISAVESAAEK